MNKLKYLLKQVVWNLKGNRKPYTTLYIANILGLIFPILFFGFSTYMYDAYTESSLLKPESTLVVSVGEFTLSDEIKRELTDTVEEVELLSDRYVAHRHIFSNQGFSFAEIIMADENFNEFYNVKLNKGRYYSDEDLRYGNKVCIIGKGLKNDLFPNVDPIGKMVYLGKDEFRVIGIIDNLQMDSRFIAPITSLPKADFGTHISTIFLLRFSPGFNRQESLKSVKFFLDSKDIK